MMIYVGDTLKFLTQLEILLLLNKAYSRYMKTYPGWAFVRLRTSVVNILTSEGFVILVFNELIN